MASITPFLRHWLAIVLVQALASECGGLVLDPAYIGEPQDVVVRKGESFTWPCRPIPGMGAPSPQVNVTWRFNGQPIRSDSRRRIDNNGSLFFKRVRRADNTDSNDYYDCVVQDIRGKLVSRPAKFYVAGLSRSSSSDENISISQGDTVWLQCRILVTPPHAKPIYEWERDRTRLPPDSRYRILPKGVLEITNVQLRDQGRYRCSANLAQEGRNSRQIILTVNQGSGQQTRMQFLNDKTQILTVKSGEEVIMPCGVSGLPQPTLSWFYGNGTAVDSSRFKRVGQGSLVISNVSRDYNATYICSASNSINPSPEKSSILLKVLEPPKALSDFDLSDFYPVAKFVRMTCDLSGYPSPSIKWYHNAERVTIRDRYNLVDNNYSLELKNSIREDSGYIQCIGENEAGTALVAGVLNFKMSPEAASVPQDLTIDEVTSTSMHVTWKSPEEVFSLHVVPDGGAEDSFVVQHTEYTLSGLTPHTNYTIYVVAYHSSGASKPSEKIVHQTKDDVPTAAPLPLVTPLGGNSAKVEWSPLEHKAHGVITGYEVIYRIIGSLSETVQKVAGTIHEVILTNLDPKHVYQVCVRASTSAGSSDLRYDQWVDLRLGSDSDIAAPVDLQVQTVNSSALLMTWEYDGPDLQGFLLQYHKLSDLASLPVDVKRNLAPESRRYLITSLQDNSWYRISLMAKSTTGEQSAPVVRESSTTAVGDAPDNGQHPAQPQNVVAEPFNSTAVDLAWSTNVDVDAFIVRYSPVPSNPNNDNQNKDNIITLRRSGSDRRVRIGGLEQFVWYQFQVQAEMGNHRGPPSNEVRCRTDEGIPSKPRNLHLTLKDDTTVVVNWEPPAHANGQIVKYLVVFKNGNRIVDDAMHSSWNKTYVNGSSVGADIKNLKKSASYNFKVAAITGGGPGNFSELKQIQTKDIGPTSTPRRDEKWEKEDKKMGIIIGVSIGGACIIVSIIIILLRNRCIPVRPPPAEPTTRRVNGNSYIPNVNGNGFGPHCGNVRLSSESHESYPMLPQTQIPENHLSDTRGGVGGPVIMNGIYPMNGVRVNLQPNGHVRSTPIYSEEEAERPQVPQRSSSLLANPEEYQRLVRNNSMDSIDREEGERDSDPASSQELRHSDSGSQKDRQSRSSSSTGPNNSNSSEHQQQPHYQMLSSSQEQQQQPPISATSSQKQQPQQQHGEHNSPKMPSSTTTAPSVNGTGPSRAAPARRSSDREGLDQPGAGSGGDGASHDTSSTKLLPATGRHDPLPHV